MTFDFEAHEAASLLAGAYLRLGIDKQVLVEGNDILIRDAVGWIKAPVRLVQLSARTFWQEILDQP